MMFATRKGVRSCTKHPIAKYLSYKKLSNNLKVFLSNISNMHVPKTIPDALGDLDWKLAVKEKMNALKKNATWENVELSRGKTTVGCKWVFTIKCKANGSIERYKEKLVAKEFTQIYDIDYQETFALVAKINFIWVLLSLVVAQDWPLHQLDVKNAFLNGDLEEEVYMDLPLGFEKSLGTNKVCSLKKSLYDLKPVF